jgi:hypothetical protein
MLYLVTKPIRHLLPEAVIVKSCVPGRMPARTVIDRTIRLALFERTRTVAPDSLLVTPGWVVKSLPVIVIVRVSPTMAWPITFIACGPGMTTGGGVTAAVIVNVPGTYV